MASLFVGYTLMLCSDDLVEDVWKGMPQKPQLQENICTNLEKAPKDLG